jgi:hypothetical protein
MERTSALLRGFLVLCSMVAFTTAGTASSYVEDFTTTHYRDRLNTTAEWDTVAGALRLPPLQLTLAGSCGTPGVAYGVAVDGNYAYVADNTSGLQVIDITNPANPAIAGYCATPGRAYGVAISGNHAYVADGTSQRLEVIDITNPATPTVVGSCLTPGTADAVAVDGDYAYVADAFSGLQVISIANPASPSVVGYCSLPDNASGVVLSGDYAYVADGTGGLAVVNIADPAHPTLAGSCLTAGAATNVAISGDDAYVTTTSRDLQIISIADPAHPSLAGSLGTSGEAYGLAVDGDWAYVTDVHVGLLAIDIADLAHPSIVNQYSMLSAQRVAIAGRYAYVGGHAAGMQVIRIAAPVLPRVVRRVITTNAQSVVTAGDNAYVADWLGGFKVINISFPSAPTIVGQCSTPYVAHAVAAAGDYAYVGHQLGLVVISIANPTSPAVVGGCTTSPTVTDVAVAGHYVYLADEAGLKVIDVAVPTSPAVVGSCTLPDIAEGLDVSGDFVYVADHSSGLQVIDITNPLSPLVVGSCPLPPGVIDVAVSGDYAYVANYTSGLRVIDIRNPAHPVVVGALPPVSSGAAVGVAISGDYVILSEEPFLAIVDITNPTNPNLVASCYGVYSEKAGTVAIAGDNAYIAGATVGLEVAPIFQRHYDSEANVGRSVSLGASGSVECVRLSSAQTDSIRWEVTADGGWNWQSVPPDGSWNVLAHPGVDFRWRSTHYYLGGGVNPACTHLNIEYTAAVGACCLPSGSCTVVTPADCALASGLYQGYGTTCTPNPCPAPVKTLCQVAEDDLNGVALLVGQRVTVRGRALVQGMQWSTTIREFQITDWNCCTDVFGGSLTPTVSIGDSVQVTGTVANYNGKTEITTPDLTVTVLPGQTPTPAPGMTTTGTLAAAGEPFESCLFKIHCVSIVSGAWPAAGFDANIVIDDGSGPVTMRIDKDTDIDGTPVPTGPFTVIGIGDQFDTASPYTTGWQIKPRFLDDLPWYCGNGACCYQDGTCAPSLPQGECTGVWQGYESVCDPNPCEQPTGSCCHPDGTCQVLVHSACTGDWTLAGVCNPNPCGTTGVDGGELDSDLDVRVKPNPFAGSVSLRVAGPNATPARVLIFDAGGRLVRTAWSGMLNGRAFTVTWDGRDDAGRAAANGIYTVRLESGSGHAIGRLVRLR